MFKKILQLFKKVPPSEQTISEEQSTTTTKTVQAPPIEKQAWNTWPTTTGPVLITTLPKEETPPVNKKRGRGRPKTKHYKDNRNK